MAVCAAATIASPSDASWSDVSTILGNNAFVWLLALGMTFVITTGGIDLSVGSLYALGGVLAARGSTHGPWLAILLPLVVCAAWGAVQGVLVAYGGMAPFIVTLAGLLGARGLLQALTNQGSTTYLVPTHSWFRHLGAGTWVPVGIVAALFALGWILMERTGYGATLTAIGGNQDSAVLLGLPVARAKVLVYLLSGTLAGAAGALGGARLGSGVTTIGLGYELDRHRRGGHRRHPADRRLRHNRRHGLRRPAAGGDPPPDRPLPVAIRIGDDGRGERRLPRRGGAGPGAARALAPTMTARRRSAAAGPPGGRTVAAPVRRAGRARRPWETRAPGPVRARPAFGTALMNPSAAGHHRLGFPHSD